MSEEKRRDRRRNLRISYPESQRPQVFQFGYELIDLSEEGMAVRVPAAEVESRPVVAGKDPIELTIELHDGEIIEVRGIIQRVWSDEETGDICVACEFDKPIPFQTVYMEKRYLERCASSYANFNFAGGRVQNQFETSWLK